MAYDPKSIKLSKQIKRSAAQIIDPHKRGEFIRSYVKILESESSGRSARRDRKDAQ
jgi:hypothetical protein